MQDFTLHLGFLVAFVLACALDIGTRHDPFVGVIVAGIGSVLIVAFVLVTRFGFKANGNHVNDHP